MKRGLLISMYRRDVFSFVFGLFALLDLVTLYHHPDIRWLTKPLILASLIFYYRLVINNCTHVQKIFLWGLYMALLGDILLLFSGNVFFLLGLTSFLIMQVFYSLSFYKESFHFRYSSLVFVLFLFTLVFIFMNRVWGDLAEFRIPVLIYSLCICGMSFFAFCRKVKGQNYFSIWIGTLFFIVSDGLIGWTKFHQSIDYGNLLVMITYIVAQYLITMGLISSSRTQQN